MKIMKSIFLRLPLKRFSQPSSLGKSEHKKGVLGQASRGHSFNTTKSRRKRAWRNPAALRRLASIAMASLKEKALWITMARAVDGSRKLQTAGGGLGKSQLIARSTTCGAAEESVWRICPRRRHCSMEWFFLYQAKSPVGSSWEGACKGEGGGSSVECAQGDVREAGNELFSSEKGALFPPVFLRDAL